MAVKCNITGLVLEKLNELKWGFSCKKENKASILRNYIEYLDCENVFVEDCGDIPCQEGGTTIIHSCNLNVTGISATVPNINGVFATFHLAVTNLYGGTPPFSYVWEYDTDVFDLAAGASINDPALDLEAKPGIDLGAVVTPIKVTITDSEGCTDVKQCYYTPGGMMCASGYNPCPNPKNLVIGGLYTPCPTPHKLDVAVTANTSSGGIFSIQFTAPFV